MAEALNYGCIVEVFDERGNPMGFRGRVVGSRRTPLGLLIEVAGAGRRMELTLDRIMVVSAPPLRNLPMRSLSSHSL